MVRARFTGRNHYHDGERLAEGDVVELTEAQFRLWSYQFVRLDEAEAADGDDGDEAAGAAADEDAPADAGEEPPDEPDGADGDAGDADGDGDDEGSAASDASESDAAPEPPAVDDLDPHPSDLTVDELRERVRDVDEPALVRAIREAEAADKHRSSAIDAIDARLNALEG